MTTAAQAADEYVISGTEDAPLQGTTSFINFQNTAPEHIDGPLSVSHVELQGPHYASSVILINSLQQQDFYFDFATVDHADITYTSSFAANVAGIQISNGLHDFYTQSLSAQNISVDLGGTGRANAAGILIASSTAGQKLENLYASNISTTTGGSGSTTSGIRLEVAGLEADRIEASHISSDNISAYGSYNLESQVSSDEVVFSAISSANASAYGYYTVNSVWNDAILTARTLQVSDVTGAQYAYGIRLYDSDQTADDNHDQQDHSTTIRTEESILVSGVRVNQDSTQGAGAYGIYHKGSDLSTDLLSVSDVSGKQEAVGLWTLGQITADTVVVRDVSATAGQTYGILADADKLFQSGLIIVEDVSASAEAFGYSIKQDTLSNFVSVLNIHSTGSDATGIHIQKASLNAANNADLTVAVTNVTADQGDAKGIFIDGRDSILGTTDFISVAGIQSSTGAAYGIHNANMTNTASFENTDGIFVQKVESDGGSAYGLYLQNPTTNASDIAVQDVSGSAAIGIQAGSVLTASNSVFVGNVTGKTSARGFFSSKDAEINTLTVTGVSATDNFGSAAGVRHQAADSVTYNGNVTVADVSAGNSAYGFQIMGSSEAEKVGLVSLHDGLNILSVEGKQAYGLSSQGKEFKAEGTTVVSGILGTNTAVAIAVEGGTADFDGVQITNIDSTNKSALISATDGAQITIGTAYMRSATVDTVLGYEGNFDVDADAEVNTINRLALRSLGGSSVNIGQETQATDVTIVGDIVAGRGTENDVAGGSVGIYAAAGSQIFGDVYAGNGGKVSLMLSGGTLEGQIDDYHELADSTAEADSFRNAAFYDESGNTLSVKKAGSVHLTLADGSVWTARGKNFVESLAFSGARSTVDLSQNENSSLKIGTLSGSNGVFKMKLGKPEASADGLIHSDMLYISNIEADSQNQIEVVFAEGVSSFEELDGLRFATSNHVETTKHLQLKIEDAGFFNRTLGVELETYQEGDEKNALYNGADTGEGSYKPGEDAVDGMFDTGDTNWVINSKDDPEGTSVSDAGQAVIATARSLYYNAIEIDRFNQRYGDRRYDENNKSLWARVRHDRWGTDAGVGDFKSQNTTYQMGFDYTKVNEAGKMIYGVAVDLMDGNTDYESIDGSGETKRYAVSAYATYVGDNGSYLDVVGKVGRLSNEYSVRLASGAGVSADYMNWMAGISVEAGHQLTSEGSRWFAEPQIQAQYVFVSDNDYSNGQTKIEQDNIHSFITRAGFRAGRWLGESKNANVYFKTDVLHEWAGVQDIHVSDNTTAVKGDTFSINNHGTWFDVGLGFQAPMGKSFYAYGDAEYRFGNDLYQTWTFNLGGKYVF